MKQRVLTACVFVPVLLMLVFWGGLPLFAGIVLVTVVGIHEFGLMMQGRGVRWQNYLNMIAALVFLTCVAWHFAAVLIWAIIVYIVLMIIWGRRNFVSYSEIVLTMIGVLYISCGFGLMTSIRLSYESWLYLLLIILAIWVTDSGAYIIGSKIGKHKLAPRISPKKTVEGFVGGTVSAVVLCTILAVEFIGIGVGYALVIILIVSLLAHLGDLLESLFKRWAGVKDSGNFFPGHGGVLDRFDSLLLAAPAACLLFYLYEILKGI